jgi:transcriptional regulator with GAF, ATPase, and Fis domain
MDFLAEYGPGELAVLLPELTLAEAETATERLTAAARSALTDPGAELVVRAGVAAFPDHASQPDELIDRARAALRSARAQRRQTVIGRAESAPGGGTIVEAAATRQLLSLIDKVARTPMTVLIVGETGAGKEVTAAEIHRRSTRAGGPFVKLNCACLPTNLLESELFGHEKGAFTGAERQKRGFFEAAAGGTLLLDEIGEIEPALQAKLLRVLESRTLIRVGGTREIPVDVRVLCATNRDLEREVAEERFRADLFYRIAGFTVAVPPLRERIADIIPLAERFVAEIAGELGGDRPVLSPEAHAALEAYAWPGNVRELRNAIERAAVLQSSGVIEQGDLPPAVAQSGLPAGPAPGGRDRLAEVERATIVEALRANNGNQTRAARQLGITRRALIYRMQKYGIRSGAR